MKTMDMAINQRDAQLLAKGERTTELLNVVLKVDREEYLAAESDALMIRSEKVPWADPAKSSFDKKRVKRPVFLPSVIHSIAPQTLADEVAGVGTVTYDQMLKLGFIIEQVSAA
ncbi:hypothetical protein [Paenibacillus dendritiformis]|uniref:Uncharacterized protein n=1 Tax=Paenibacillus dendritiformis C454 TaxID=1131935 RepID=H3SFG7_9BACL|nr:hypothetical protein [Paenibacillus dendritiformis]EHQ62196.1 hypothetical protein PDENDC454_11360 [Paenibacillus dendritiformis C454]CAH8771556.1 hypothetical protein H7S4_004291 [Paenibacillus dendritiformis]